MKNNKLSGESKKMENGGSLSREEKSGWEETRYLLSIPWMEARIIEGMKTPLEECFGEEEVDL